MWGSVDPEAPMRVLRFLEFESFGKLPRSSDKKSVLISEVPDYKIIFISHRWLRPWQHLEMFLEWYNSKETSVEECKWADEEGLKEYYSKEGGIAHPDDSKGTKHKLICASVKKLCEEKGWDVNKVCIWLDFAGVFAPHLFEQLPTAPLQVCV